MQWYRRHTRGRPPHPDVLTPAEWRVLHLVREGLPNAEIAIRLGIAVTTVKTHVSRILAKTGAADRQALIQWDGHPADVASTNVRRGFATSLIGWLAEGPVVTSAKIVAGGVATATFAVTLLVAYSAISGASGGGVASPAADPLIGFYVESTMEYSALSGQPYPIIERASEGTVRRWYVDEERWRAEVVSHDSGVLTANSTIAVARGDHMLVYDRLRHTYTRLPLIDGTGDANRSLLGPAPGGNLDQVIASIEAEFATRVERAGSAEYLGRGVDMVEYDLPGGRHRLSIDPAMMWVLLHEIDGGEFGRSRRFAVTHFEPNATIERQLFEFTPPPGAEERISQLDPETGESGCPDSQLQPSGITMPAPPGFLALNWLPNGWQPGGGGVAHASSCDMTGSWAVLFAGNSDGYLMLEQSRMRAGIPSWLRHSDPTDVNGHEAYRFAEGGLERLVWIQDDLVALLESDRASFEELMRMAASAELVIDPPTGGTPTPVATARATPVVD